MRALPCWNAAVIVPTAGHSRRGVRCAAVAAPPRPRVERQAKKHSMPPEKVEIFRSLEGWATEGVLPLLKPVEKCWQPQDFLPDAAKPVEEFAEEVRALRKRTAELSDEYFVVLVGDMITEEALPTYQTMINTLDGVKDETGASDCAWARWTRNWTAEENRHGDLLARYLYLSGRVDMRMVEKTVQYLIGSGMMSQVDVPQYELILAGKPHLSDSDRRDAKEKRRQPRVVYKPRGPVERRVLSTSFQTRRLLRTWINKDINPVVRERMIKYLQVYNTMIEEENLQDPEHHSEDESGGAPVEAEWQPRHDPEPEWFDDLGPTPTPFTHLEPQQTIGTTQMQPSMQYHQPPPQYMEPSSQFMQPSSQYVQPPSQFNVYGEGSSHSESFSIGDTQGNFMDMIFASSSYNQYQSADPAFYPPPQQMPYQPPAPPLPHTQSARYAPTVPENIPSEERRDHRGGRGGRRRGGVFRALGNVVSNVIRPRRSTS